MKRQTKHVKRRRGLGLCAREGCLVSTGERYYCPAHAAYQREMGRLYRAKKKLLATAVAA